MSEIDDLIKSLESIKESLKGRIPVIRTDLENTGITPDPLKRAEGYTKYMDMGGRHIVIDIVIPNHEKRQN